MPPNSDAQIISDRKRLTKSFYQKLAVIAGLFLVLMVGVYAAYAYYIAPITQAELESANSEAFINELIASAAPFTFEIVPDALTILTMPEPGSDFESQEALTDEFSRARANYLDQGDSEVPSIYDMPVGEMTYLDYMNELPRDIQDPFLQMLSEVEVLVATLNKSYSQATLAARIDNSQTLLFPDATLNTEGELSVYPSLRVAQAHFAAEVLARQLPSEAEFFREYANSFIQDGVAYGHYSKQDASLTQLLIDDYLNAAVKNESGAFVLQSFEQ